MIVLLEIFINNSIIFAISNKFQIFNNDSVNLLMIVLLELIINNDSVFFH